MRISDWSSDVCSSDLDVVEFDIGFDRILKTDRGLTEDLDLLAHIHHIDLGAPFGGQCRHLGFDAEPPLEQLDHVAEILDLVARALERLIDRKSVVSGTSWSVRVDFGGLQII